MTASKEPKFAFSLTEIGRMVGVSANAMATYAKMSGFPEADENGKRPSMPCIAWWLTHKAPEKLQRQLHGELSDSLGIANDGSVAAADNMSESDRLDLQLKAHKVAKAVGDAVSFADIRGIVGTLAANIRQACAGVNAATGRDVLPLFDQAFDEFEASLDESIEAIQQGSA